MHVMRVPGEDISLFGNTLAWRLLLLVDVIVKLIASVSLTYDSP